MNKLNMNHNRFSVFLGFCHAQRNAIRNYGSSAINNVRFPGTARLFCVYVCAFSFTVSTDFSFNNIISSRRRDSNDDNGDDAEYERSSFSSKISPILLRFRNRKWEISFLHEQDLMLKYSTFMCFVTFLGIIVSQALNNP